MHPAKHRVCPAFAAGHLDSQLRRWLQKPEKVVGPYVKEGMTVLDLGCGPGFFTLDLARMVGPAGCVIACDLQAAMLERVRRKVAGTALETRVRLHQCSAGAIGLSELLDFVLAFYVVHELVEASAFFREIVSLLKPGGRLLVVEPPLHVSRKLFEDNVRTACTLGFYAEERPKSLVNKSILLRKNPESVC